ncbi:hypothetical protein J3A83DRAFT_1420231 [Scleroderma citrinum]
MQHEHTLDTCIAVRIFAISCSIRVLTSLILSSCPLLPISYAFSQVSDPVAPPDSVLVINQVSVFILPPLMMVLRVHLHG